MLWSSAAFPQHCQGCVLLRAGRGRGSHILGQGERRRLLPDSAGAGCHLPCNPRVPCFPTLHPPTGNGFRGGCKFQHQQREVGETPSHTATKSMLAGTPTSPTGCPCTLQPSLDAAALSCWGVTAAWCPRTGVPAGSGGTSPLQVKSHRLSC